MKKTLCISLVLALASTICPAQRQPADYVNPFIGTSTSVEAAGALHGLGKTFPGATTPFGLVQVSPQTISGGDNAPGYSYDNRTIEGFSLNQMSGVGWFGEMGNFLMMPATGELRLVAGTEDGRVKGYRSRFDKATETASPAYYSCFLEDYGIRVETTASRHCGVYRFTYPKAKDSRFQIDLARRVGGSSDYQKFEILDDHTFCGWIVCTPKGGGWGNGKGEINYTLYFYGTSSASLKNCCFYSADIPEGMIRKRDEVVSEEYLKMVADSRIIRGSKSIDGPHIGVVNTFRTSEGEEVEVKVGISYVDARGARQNFLAEVADKDFDAVHSAGVGMWNEELGRIKVSGGTEEERIVLYSSLYHSFIDPRIYADVDGRYIGGDLMPYDADPSFTKRTLFSGWDVFRSQFPLMTIINPRLVSDSINSLITLAEQSRRFYFERWELFNSYSGCMLGNPAISVIADAYVKGIRTFDSDKALKYSINSSVITGNGPEGYTGGKSSISYTLEYAYFDWCIAQIAKAKGNTKVYEEYMDRGQYYKNIFRDEVGWFCPRAENGEWEKWPGAGRLKENFGSMESNPYQQGWFVPQDVDGMVALMGGRDKVLEDLTSFFENVPKNMLWNPYYNHANEPVHLVPYLFNRLDAPWLTQKWTRHICRYAYSNKVEGLVGNEDAGQMSAWYILSACGIHPSCPGETRMEITSPVFDEIEFSLDTSYFSGRSFKVIAHGNSPENIYIQSAKLNGAPYDKCWIDFSDIAAGSTLELYMGAEPNHNWGIHHICIGQNNQNFGGENVSY